MTNKLHLIALLMMAISCRDSTPSDPHDTNVPTSSHSTSIDRPSPEEAPDPDEATPPEVAGPMLMPIDEALRDPSLVAFRDRLLTVIRNRDSEGLLAIVDSNVRTSFGPSTGIDDFREQWNPESPDSPIWTELESILTRGGTFNESASEPQFWAPYIYSAWPDRHDAFTSLVALHETVPLRENADESSAVVALLSYDIVQVSPDDSEHPRFRRVTTADGREGWVRSDLVRSPIDYRAALTKTDDGWRLTALVAGD